MMQWLQSVRWLRGLRGIRGGARSADAGRPGPRATGHEEPRVAPPAPGCSRCGARRRARARRVLAVALLLVVWLVGGWDSLPLTVRAAAAGAWVGAPGGAAAGARGAQFGCGAPSAEVQWQLVRHHRELAEAALAEERPKEAQRELQFALACAGIDPELQKEVRRLAAAQETEAALDAPSLYDRRLPSIVQVRAGGLLGSGVVVEPGVVLTNAHVLAKDVGTLVTASGEEVHFDWSLKHPSADVAVIRAPELAAPPAPLGQGLSLRPGDPVSLIGNPRGLAFSFSDGSVSAVNRKLEDGPTRMIQFTAPISMGSSGAPLFDRSGRVAALASRYYDSGQALNFAVPIEYGIELIGMMREDRARVAEAG